MENKNHSIIQEQINYTIRHSEDAVACIGRHSTLFGCTAALYLRNKIYQIQNELITKTLSLTNDDNTTNTPFMFL